ncbi:hypothetical protein J6590_001735 [Homalodisca vitripennis]|nr:hypothetical protein J6590_001735 [Homalodisca vitripennis]
MFASCVSVRTTMRRDGQHAPATKLSSPPRPASFTTRTTNLFTCKSHINYAFILAPEQFKGLNDARCIKRRTETGAACHTTDSV